MSISSVTRSGMLLIAPGWTRQTPVVATLSGPPADQAAASTASTASAAAQRASLPAGHQHRARVPTLALPGHPHRRRGRDRRDDADREPLALEDRPLLDVQLDEGRVVPSGRAGLSTARHRIPRRGGSRRGRGPPRRAARPVASAVSVPQSARLPRQPMPNRVGSSLVNINSSIDRSGRNPPRCSARIASSPPRTPTVPSNRPECGIASMCEPVPTGGQVGREAFPARERVADRVLADDQPRLACRDP